MPNEAQYAQQTFQSHKANLSSNIQATAEQTSQSSFDFLKQQSESFNGTTSQDFTATTNGADVTIESLLPPSVMGDIEAYRSYIEIRDMIQHLQSMQELAQSKIIKEELDTAKMSLWDHLVEFKFYGPPNSEVKYLSYVHDCNDLMYGALYQEDNGSTFKPLTGIYPQFPRYGVLLDLPTRYSCETPQSTSGQNSEFQPMCPHRIDFSTPVLLSSLTKPGSNTYGHGIFCGVLCDDDGVACINGRPCQDWVAKTEANYM